MKSRIVCRCFRPLAGIMVLICFHCETKAMSPASCFRPLAGIMVLVTHNLIVLSSRDVKRFRPLAGIMVLIARVWPTVYYGVSVKRFRPLAGIMVLILPAELIAHDCGDPFPSPCGDYGSYRNFLGFYEHHGQ